MLRLSGVALRVTAHAKHMWVNTCCVALTFSKRTSRRRQQSGSLDMQVYVKLLLIRQSHCVANSLRGTEPGRRRELWLAHEKSLRCGFCLREVLPPAQFSRVATPPQATRLVPSPAKPTNVDSWACLDCRFSCSCGRPRSASGVLWDEERIMPMTARLHDIAKASWLAIDCAFTRMAAV